MVFLGEDEGLGCGGLAQLLGVEGWRKWFDVLDEEGKIAGAEQIKTGRPPVFRGRWDACSPLCEADAIAEGHFG